MNRFTFTTYTGHSYTIAYIDNKFCLQDDEAPAGTRCNYWINVKPDYGYTYKIMKTMIKASNGAAGLYDFIRECYTQHIMECHVDRIIEAITAGYIRPAA